MMARYFTVLVRDRFPHNKPFAVATACTSFDGTKT